MRLLRPLSKGRATAVGAGVALVAATLVGTATSAQAAGTITVTVSGNVVTVIGSDLADSIGVRNECDGGTCPEVRVGVETMTAGPGCSIFYTTVTCDTPGSATVNISLGAGNDSYTTDHIRWQTGHLTSIVVDGGPGNDTFIGADVPETFAGGDGDDRVQPDDHWVGPDDISGGPGSDTVDYLYSGLADEGTGMTLSLDDVANDTNASTADIDNLHSDIEVLGATNLDDTIVANDSAQTIEGGAGNDTITGLGGADSIAGGPGSDTIDGGAGADTIFGDWDNDTITGGAGADTINGDGVDLMVTGNDVIDAVDGEVDSIACGPGSDQVKADQGDEIGAHVQDNCESISRTGGGGPGGSSVHPRGKRLDANARRTSVKLKIACAGAASCTGKVKVKSKAGKVLATGKYRVAKDSTGVARLKLTKAARVVLRKKARVKVKVVLVPASGTSVTKRFILTR